MSALLLSEEVATSKQRADLQRIAFGRTHSRADEDAAAAARQELADADRAAADADRAAAAAQRPATARGLAEADSRAVAAATYGRRVSAPSNDELPPPPPEPPQKRNRRIRAAWLVPIIAGSLAVGYFGAPDAAVQSLADSAASMPPSASPGPSSSEVPAPTIGEPSIAGPSSLKEADAWFEVPPGERDGFSDADFLQRLKIDPSAVRFVQINAAGFQVWVARTLDDDLCVLSTNSAHENAAGCTPRATFSSVGLTLAQSGYSISWTGSRVTVSSPRSQLVG